MTDYSKLTPDVTPLHQPFWDAVKAHELRLQRCDGCGTFRYIPSEMCNKCYAEESTWTPASGRGEIYTYTVVHRGPTAAYQAEAPYVIVHVQLPEGVRMISQLVECSPDTVKISMPVRVVYEDVTAELSLFKFTPA